MRKEALTGNEAVTALGNIRRDNNTYSSDNHYCLFDFSVPVDNKPLLSVTFTNTGYAYASIMALSAMKSLASGIQPATIGQHAQGPAAIYDLRGQRLQHLQKGLNIVRMPDGRVRKVMR